MEGGGQGETALLTQIWGVKLGGGAEGARFDILKTKEELNWFQGPGQNISATVTVEPQDGDR